MKVNTVLEALVFGINFYYTVIIKFILIKIITDWNT